MILFTALLLYPILINECSSSWLLGPSDLPQRTKCAAIAYDDINDTILLFGGVGATIDVSRQFVTFKDHQFIDVGLRYLSYDQKTSQDTQYLFGQYYTQLGDELWVVTGQTEGELITIDTHSYAVTTSSIKASNFGSGGCLASSPGFLFAIRGNEDCYKSSYDPMIYDIENEVWLSGVPPIGTKRRFAGCAVAKHMDCTGFPCILYTKLYVIGGQDLLNCDNTALSSIEVLNNLGALPTTTSISWSVFPDTLSTARWGSSVVVDGTYIYVIGGEVQTPSIPGESQVNIIDITTGNVVVSDTLERDIIHASAIVANNVMFAFGGGSYPSTYYDSYQYKTIGPTRAPTPKPTASPTLVPTRSPTKSPTVNTFNPSIPPTYHPTLMPSVPPTKAPTTLPTIAPTTMPSVPPTIKPTMAPSVSPTIKPTTPPTTKPTSGPTKTESTVQDSDDNFKAIQYDRLDTLGTIHRWIFGGFISVIVVISLLAWMDAKCVASRKNDYLQITFIVGISLQTMDMFSDCFFAVNMGIWKAINPIYVYVLILSVCFVVVPCAFTIVQLILHSRKHWFNSSDKVRGWLGSRSNMLYFASIITGSSFAAVALCNSYMFQLDAFDMGLTKKEIQAFMYKRVYSVVLLENIPQLALQSYFVYTLGTLDDLVTISSIIFSLLSIIVSILSMFTQRSISRRQGTVSISMTVTGPSVVEKATNCKRMKNALIKELSILVGVARSITEIIKPVHIKQGFQITVQFNVADSDQDFYRTLTEAQEKSELQNIFKRAWDLSDIPIVGDLKQTVVQSKRERLDSDSLSDGKKTDARQPDVVTEMYNQKPPPPPGPPTATTQHVNSWKPPPPSAPPPVTNTPWNCSICTYSNNPSLNHCQMCNNPKN